MKLAVLGKPISHSKSPSIHNAALEASGLAGSYEARAVDAAGVRTAFEELRSGAISGFNVTMPHKALAASLCDRLEPQAATAGSVNTVAMIEGSVWGFSTDIWGITDVWGGLPTTGPVLILGAGGAAAAACVALSSRILYVAARRFGAGTELAKRLPTALNEVRWGVPVIKAVVVNCTPLGMLGESLPEAVLELCDGLFDMAYGPDVTPAVQRVREAGFPAVEGLDLLVAQAARSFEIWTGVKAPLAAMKKGAKTA